LKAKYASSKGGPLRGGEVASVDMGPGDLFGEAIADGGMWLYLASVTSVDAQAIRLRVDLSALESGAEVWVIDPQVPRAFGPYAATAPDGKDSEEGAQWLAATQGEEAVLMVRMPSAVVPQVRLAQYSHIFLSFKEIAKLLPCNIDLACETDETILEDSSGTAIILVGGDWFCSGVLINNAQTETASPFFLTANHCICTRQEARTTEVYWDYRNSTCHANDAPEMDSLSRSNGVGLLAASADLDLTLIRLDTVPVGDYGRTYLGWDTRAPVVDDSVLTIHYPDASHMRITKGLVRSVGDQEGGREKLVKVHWDEGVTEAGSSGAPLLFAETVRIAGALSQGPDHTCGLDRSGNIDWFGSFRDFYPLVSQYIDTPTPSTEDGVDDCQQTVITCPFQSAYADYPALLEDFRAIRDKLLLRNAWGKGLVGAYYSLAPGMARVVTESPLARGLFMTATAPFAELGAALR
jgi:hypothetical protein